jgi:hypothetical protein
MAEVLDLLGDNIMDDLNPKHDDGDEEFWKLKLEDNLLGDIWYFNRHWFIKIKHQKFLFIILLLINLDIYFAYNLYLTLQAIL